MESPYRKHEPAKEKPMTEDERRRHNENTADKIVAGIALGAVVAISGAVAVGCFIGNSPAEGGAGAFVAFSSAVMCRFVTRAIDARL